MIDLIEPLLQGLPGKYDRAALARELQVRQSSAHHFTREHRGSVLLASAGELPHGPGRCLVVDLLKTNKPGDGLFLLREMLRWADARPVIKFTWWAPLFDTDDRFERVARRLGFARMGSVFQRNRHGTV